MPGLKITDQDQRNIAAKFFCTLCTLLMIKPVQTLCGHLFCSSCVEELEKNHPVVCPLDGSKIAQRETFPDNFTRREILDLRIHCLNSDCPWFNSVKDYQNHSEVCDEALLSCIYEQCNETMIRSSLEHHLKSECFYREVNCDYCQSTLSFHALRSHHGNCPAFPVSCQYCSKSDIPRFSLGNHEKVECEEITIGCDFKTIGCTHIEVGKRKVLRDHFGNSLVFHLNLLLQFVLGNNMTERITPVEVSRIIEVTKRELCSIVEPIVDKVSAVSVQVASLVESLRGLQTRVENIESNRAVPQRRGKTMQSNDSESFFDLSKKYERLVKERVDLRTELRLKDTILERLQTKFTHLEDRLALTAVKLAELVKVSAPISYNGTLIWRIVEFNRKRQEAINGTVTAIYSPPFYSAQYGYKMCVRIYINGDGFGKGSHISLFFVIMKGEYDILLPWPFQNKITMMILDQVTGYHMIDAFRSDPDSSSFQKPKNKLNIASGSPLFLPLESLNSVSNRAYVKDDVMFVKVMVD